MFCGLCKAQNDLETILKNAPNGVILDYLTQNDWLDCMDYHAAGMLSEGATSALSGKVVLNEITPTFAQLSVGESMSVQIGLLRPTQEQDSTYLICMIKTFSIDSCLYSRVELRDAKWQKLNVRKYLDIPEWNTLFCKPDTMSAEEYKEIMLLPVSHLMYAELDKSDNSVNFMATNTSLNADERKRVASILIKKKVKWKIEI